jgi:hypothetical protein
VVMLAEDAERYERAYGAWKRGLAHRDRLVAAAEQRVLDATGGLGQRRWELACARRRINTGNEALMVARAIRARPAVEAAVANLGQVRRREEAVVAAARVELAEAAKVLGGYGQLGARLSGLSPAALRRLARRPPGASPTD